MVCPLGVIARHRGFTLIEILVAMVIMAMVTLLVAVGLRVGVRAWQRGVEEDDIPQVMAAVPAMMERQLGCIVKEAPFPTPGQILPFCGDAHRICFFSSYNPLGSAFSGLVRVCYLYDSERQILYLFQQIVTNVSEFQDQPDPFSDQGPGDLRPVSEIHGVKGFALSYSRKFGPAHHDEPWKDEWQCRARRPPEFVRLGLDMSQGRDEGGKGEKVWVFRVGI